MTSPAPETLAALHASAITQPPPWSAAAFAGCLDDPACFVLTVPAGATAEAQPPVALLVGRVTLDEAELLTLATAPTARRQGLARQLLQAFTTEAAARRAVTAFLEVAESNAAARALYASDGWETVGRRAGYYRDTHGRRDAALILRKPLPAG